MVVNNEESAESGDPVGLLERGLRVEMALLADLAQGLVHQREAIAADDTAALEQPGQQLSRTLLTLREARRQRGILVEMVAGRADARLGDVVACLPPEAAPAMTALCRELKDRALAANRELTINQTVIRRAIESGERFLQHLLTDPNLELYWNRNEAEVAGGPLLNDRA